VQRHIDNLPCSLRQAPLVAGGELKDRAVARRILTAIPLRAVGLFARFDYLSASAARTVDRDSCHRESF